MFVTRRLQDKTAIVAGAGQTPGETIGNGRAISVRFAEEGAQVVCVDRDLNSAQETVDLILEQGGTAVAVQADVTSESDCVAAVEACISQFGSLDILVNNVGIGTGDSGPTRIDEDVWDHIMAVNLKGALFATKHALPHMREQRGGSIINISSIASICATGLTAYKASKAALNAYTHTVAMSNAKHGIRANVILPGLMNTPMAIESHTAAGADRETLIKGRDKAVPLAGGMGTASDVANAALFLASDEASFITGVNLPVDGGQSARIG